MPDVEIIAVLDDPSKKSRQLVALNLASNPTRLVPKWCSQQLPPGDFFTPASSPSIAQLDAPHPAVNRPEIIIDNKVFNFDGTLRYNGTCATCSRSRTSIVANVSAPTWRPQVITGHGAYRSAPPVALAWNGTAWWTAPALTNSALTYSAVADLDLSGIRSQEKACLLRD